MTIAAGAQVSLEYTLKLRDDTVVDSNVGAAQPLTYTHGQGDIIPGLERQLTGMVVGETRQLEVTPDEAYGEAQSEAVQEVSREQVPEDARQQGARVQAQTPSGDMVLGQVVDVRDDTIVIDFNHPLAGETLHFTVKVLAVEPASEQEST